MNPRDEAHWTVPGTVNNVFTSLGCRKIEMRSTGEKGPEGRKVKVGFTTVYKGITEKVYYQTHARAM